MKWILATCIAGLCTQVMADTVVNVRGSEGGAEKISIRGDWIRMDGLSGDGEYVLGDVGSGLVYVVMPRKKSILELKNNKGKAVAKRPQTEVKKLGKGPSVAGFDTTEYQLQVNGENCGKALLSSEAAQLSDVKKLLTALDQFNPESMMPEGMGDMMTSQIAACDRAKIAAQGQIAALGMPMKTVDAKGAVEQEIVSINAQVTLPQSLFTLPAGYQRTSPGAIINDAMSQMQEMMKNVSPEQKLQMEQLMKQFGGQLPK